MLTIPLDKWTGTDKLAAGQHALMAQLVRIEGKLDTLLKENAKMADVQKINAALDTLQNTIDLTQENVAALLQLVKSNPSAAELAEIERRLQEMQSDLGGTSFDTSSTTGGETGGDETGDTQPPTS